MQKNNPNTFLQNLYDAMCCFDLEFKGSIVKEGRKHIRIAGLVAGEPKTYKIYTTGDIVVERG